jgi:hypothetical protein
MNVQLYIDAAREAVGITSFATKFAMVGSSYIHQQLRADVDILVLSPFRRGLRDILVGDGWEEGGSQDLSLHTCWVSLKKELTVNHQDGIPDILVFNIIVVEDEAYFDDWVRAAEACRFLVESGVRLTRGQTHGVHAVIMDGRAAEEEVTHRIYDYE